MGFFFNVCRVAKVVEVCSILCLRQAFFLFMNCPPPEGRIVRECRRFLETYPSQEPTFLRSQRSHDKMSLWPLGQALISMLLLSNVIDIFLKVNLEIFSWPVAKWLSLYYSLFKILFFVQFRIICPGHKKRRISFPLEKNFLVLIYLAGKKGNFLEFVLKIDVIGCHFKCFDLVRKAVFLSVQWMESSMELPKREGQKLSSSLQLILNQ